MNKIKIFAMAAVAMMMMSGAVVLMDSDSSDAAEGVLESLYPYSWTWDEDTGMGPFNSFYAAFDMTDGNKFYAVLNPYDLSKTIDGVSLDPSKYNIMWVLPTVYWKATGNDVIITNDSTSGGTAYAHTIDGKVYKYVAYGVYHGAKKDVGGVTVLTSESGVAPTASQTRAVFRDQANNNVMDSSLGTDAHAMLWNFYQWTLYKLCCWTVMGDFNSQQQVGFGNVYGGNYTKVSGSLNKYGPYAGRASYDMSSAATNGKDAAKLFIEEPWGTVWDFVDGVIVDGGNGFYIDTSSVPTDSTTVGGNVEFVQQALPTSSDYVSEITTNEKIWGMGTALNGTNEKGLTDYYYGSSSSNRVLFVGGNSTPNASTSPKSGLSFAYASLDTSRSDSNIGSRLAFVFDTAPTMATTPYTYTLSYDPSLMATTSKAISVAGMDPISHEAPPVTVPIQPNDSTYGTVSPVSVTAQAGTVITTTGNTLTIDTTTITATPAAATAQYTYAFDGWYVGDVQIESGVTTINTDTTITARFAATVNTYTVTIQPSDPLLGSVDVSTIPDVPYGSTITVSGNTLTIGSTTVTATPNEGYETKWSVRNGATISGDMTITATFQEPSSPTENLLNLVPFFIVIAIVMAAIAGIRMSGSDPMAIVKLVIGLAVVVIIFATLVLPILGQV